MHERGNIIKRYEGAGAPPPAGPYSPGIRFGDTLYVSGQGPFAADGSRIGETFADQVRITMGNIAKIAEAAGTTLDQAVRMGAYLQSLDDFQEFNAVVAEFLTEPYPARTTIQADLRGFDVEIDMGIAVTQ